MKAHAIKLAVPAAADISEKPRRDSLFLVWIAKAAEARAETTPMLATVPNTNRAIIRNPTQKTSIMVATPTATIIMHRLLFLHRFNRLPIVVLLNRIIASLIVLPT